MRFALAAQRPLRRLLFVVCSLALGSAHADSPPPLLHFLQIGGLAAVKLSPSGRHVALTGVSGSGITRLVVLDTETMQGRALPTVTDTENRRLSIYKFEWVNDNRLVYNVQAWEMFAQREHPGMGLFGQDRDGENFRQLVDRWPRGPDEPRRWLDRYTRLHAPTRRQDGNDVFVTRGALDANGDVHDVRLLRLDTTTGNSEEVAGPGFARQWLVDQNDTPRIVVTADGSRGALHHFDRATRQWERLLDFENIPQAVLEPVEFSRDGALLIAANQGQDKRALYRFDVAARRFDAEPLMAPADFDFKGEVVQDVDHLLGVRYASVRSATTWFDPRMKEIQARVDELLPATLNVVEPPTRGEVPLVLVMSYSDIERTSFRLFNTATGQLTLVGNALSRLDSRHLARLELVRFAARDGLPIPAWLAIPESAKGRQAPMVLVVSNDPWARDRWTWRPETQFLASRGYVVLQPEARGQWGHGAEHFRKGVGQWGLGMQDDLADAARWAIAQGIADPDRICILGASYGGYAALMGLARNPDLFKCGVAWSAITDLYQMQAATWRDELTPAMLANLPSVHGMQGLYGMAAMVGDPGLESTSPLRQARRIRSPLLLAHGGADWRVPLAYVVKLRDAIAEGNPGLEWVEYAEESHRWYGGPSSVDFWTRVEKFLQKNIGDRAPQ